MTISVRVNPKEGELFKSYAALKKLSLSEIVRNAILEKIEDEYDLKCYEEAMKEYRKNPVSYSHDEVKKMIGIE